MFYKKKDLKKTICHNLKMWQMVLLFLACAALQMTPKASKQTHVCKIE